MQFTTPLFHLQGLELGHLQRVYPTSVYNQSCAVYSGYIYCVGGFSTTPSATDDVYYAALSSSGVGTWKSTTNYPTVIVYQECLGDSGFIYCVGGDNPNSVDDVYYAPVSSSGVGSWTSTTNYPTTISVLSCVAFSGYIYCMGGSENGLTDTDAIYYSALSSSGVGSWTSTTNYPTVINEESCVQDAGYIYCVAGFVEFGTSSSAVYYTEIESPTTTTASTSTTTETTSSSSTTSTTTSTSTVIPTTSTTSTSSSSQSSTSTSTTTVPTTSTSTSTESSSSTSTSTESIPTTTETVTSTTTSSSTTSSGGCDPGVTPPQINSVTGPVYASGEGWTLTITGTCFGNTSPTSNPSTIVYGDNSVATQPDNTYPSIIVVDQTQGWGAGFGGDIIGIQLVSWSDSQIVIDGFGGAGVSTTPVGPQYLIQVGNLLGIYLVGPDCPNTAYGTIGGTPTAWGPSFSSNPPTDTWPAQCSASGFIYVTSPLVTPEFPLGTLLAIVAPLSALLIYFVARPRITAPKTIQ